jgi:hypothetical protein
LNHFLRMEVYECRLRVEAIDTDGAVFDSYEIDHCGASGSTSAVASLGAVRSVFALAPHRGQDGWAPRGRDSIRRLPAVDGRYGLSFDPLGGR